MYIDINGKKMFYKVNGNKKPLILIHGNSRNHNIFKKIIPMLENNFKIYQIDLFNCGKSEKREKYNYDILSDDIYYFIKQLNIKKPIIYGFSDGGIIGILVAIKYPDLISKLVVSGVNSNPKGIKLIYRLLFKLKYIIKKDKLIQMMLKEPKITKEMLNDIKIKTFITTGEFDIIKKRDTLFIYENIKNSEIKIFKKSNHSNYVVNSAEIGNYLIDVLKRS